MAPSPGLTIDITEKRYAASKAPALAELHLELAPGTVTAILGPSGVGKSTLLRIIAGIDRDFAGAVTIAGKAASEAPPPGFVFQDPRLLPWLTALGNVQSAGSGVEKSRALEALRKTGLSGYEDFYPHQLSGGMQRRVALARALTLNSGVLLLDEPFVSLDRLLVEEMYDGLADIVDQERPTTVLVTHIAQDAARLADRVLVLAGQPSTIAADISLPLPRADRDAATLGDYRMRIEALA